MPAAKHPREPEKLEGTLKNLHASIWALHDVVAKDVSVGRSLWLSFLKGIAASLGALAVAILIIPIMLQLLQEVEWVPMVGDFLNQVAERMEETQQR